MPDNSPPRPWPGWQQPAARVSPKFFYDALGSRLFDAITELDEYYLTRTEAQIFTTHSGHRCSGPRGLWRQQHPGRPGGRQLRQGRPPVPGRCSRAATWRWTSRWTTCAEALAQPAARHPASRWPAWVWTSRPGWRFRRAGRIPGADLLPRLQHRQLHAARGAAPAARGTRAGAGRRAADRGGPGQGQVPAGRRLRRPAGGHRRLQPQPAEPPEPPGRQRLRLHDWRHVALLRGAESRIEMHLEARRASRALARWRARFCGGRAHPHRELLQVERPKASPRCCATPAGAACSTGAMQQVTSRCSWRPEGTPTRLARRKLPIGIQNLREIREEGHYYVDKTGWPST
jgi:hypothetical protein